MRVPNTEMRLEYAGRATDSAATYASNFWEQYARLYRDPELVTETPDWSHETHRPNRRR